MTHAWHLDGFASVHCSENGVEGPCAGVFTQIGGEGILARYVHISNHYVHTSIIHTAMGWGGGEKRETALSFTIV